MEKKRVFIYESTEALKSLRESVEKALKKCGTLEILIKGFGFPLTKDIVTDCLMLGKKTEQRPAKNPTKFIGVEPGQVPDVFEAVEVFTNTEHLDKALAVMLDKIEKSEQRQNEKRKRAEDLRSDYNVFLGNVYGLFHVRRFVVDTSELVKFFDIENEHIVIPESSHKQMREQASVYTETSQGIEAYKLHKVIVENINELLGLLKNADRVRISEDLGSLFRADGEGNVTTAPVDYDFYCN